MMKVKGNWIRAGHVQTVLRIMTGGGHRALLVGGCVRNDLLGHPVADIDIATDATPLRVIELASQAGVKSVPTGIDHGTVTVIAEGVPHEVTTFRQDIETDGRRAVVAYTRRIEEDAARRDFTMNALYAEADGTVIDPIGGLADLVARRVRFVGDPDARIREDYLRILRFFRFHAWYGDPAEGMDAEALAACASNLGGLSPLSKERIGHEMRRLLAAPDPAPSVAAMQASGVLATVLPGADAHSLPALVHLEGNRKPDWLRRLAVLRADNALDDLRLSRDEARRLDTISAAAVDGEGPAAVGYRLGSDDGLNAILVRAALLGNPVPESALTDLEIGAAAVFPVKAADLMPTLSGEALGRRLKELEALWISSGFALSREQLLS